MSRRGVKRGNKDIEQRGYPVKNWSFTINNPTQSSVFKTDDPFGLWCDEMSFLHYQLEEGGNCNTRHLQGYLQLKTKKRFEQVKAFPNFSGCHLEASKYSAKKNIEYCSKEDGRVDGPWSLGTPCMQGQRTDLEDFARKIMEDPTWNAELEEPAICLKYPAGVKHLRAEASSNLRGHEFRKPSIIVYCGPSGCGKSRSARNVDPHLYRVPFNQGQHLWFNGYKNQRTILIEEYYGRLPYSYFLELLDGYPMQGESKGNFITLNHDTLIITSNESPEYWYTAQVQAPTYAMVRRLTEFGKVYKWDEEKKEFILYEVPKRPVVLINGYN